MASQASQRDDGVERQLHIQYDVSAALAESETVAEAAPRVLATIVQHLGWALGVFWLVDDQDRQLTPVAIHGDERAHGTFLRATREQTFECGVGLPGQVWRTQQPEWVSDVIDLANYPRQQLARRAGLHSALAVPLSVDAHIVGVLEFYASRVTRPDPDVSRALEGVSRQVGQFIARKSAVARELEAQARSAAVLDTALDAFVMMDAQGTVLDWNAAAQRTFGWSRDDALGKRLDQLIIPPSLREAHVRGLARYLATGEARILDRRIETQAVRRDGSEFPVELAITRVPLAGARVFAGHLRDLTEQQRFAREQRLLLDASTLLASSLDYETTLRNLSDVVVPAFADWYAVDVLADDHALVRLTVVHRDPTRVELARELADQYTAAPDSEYGAAAAVRTGKSQLVPVISDAMLGALAQEPGFERIVTQLGLRSFIVVPMRTTERVVGAITLVTAESGRHYDERDLQVAEELGRRGGQAIENARLFRELDDTRESLEEQASELEVQSSELQRATSELESTVEDLQTANEELVKRTHEAERARAEAEAARLEADQANRTKSEFLATMSHELRTPLNAIVGYAQLLEIGVHGGLATQQRDDVARIIRSSHHLLGLINDLLNFAKVEAGQLQLHMQPVAIADVLVEVEDLVRPQSREKRLEYRLINRCPEVKVCADRDKLAQVFTNLLTNAVRYTPEGGRIEVICTADDHEVSARVRDTGVGIPADKLDAIFEPFVHLGVQYAGERQGTGLGLAITRELARAMGGDISVESVVGEGSTFTVRLPRE